MRKRNERERERGENEIKIVVVPAVTRERHRLEGSAEARIAKLRAAVIKSPVRRAKNVGPPGQQINFTYQLGGVAFRYRYRSTAQPRGEHKVRSHV